jgi:hypothetical protein
MAPHLRVVTFVALQFGPQPVGTLLVQLNGGDHVAQIFKRSKSRCSSVHSLRFLLPEMILAGPGAAAYELGE